MTASKEIAALKTTIFELLTKYEKYRDSDEQRLTESENVKEEIKVK